VSDVLLRTVGLRQDFGLGRDRFHALRGIDLEVHRGRTLGLVGESGCGKSTLARAVLLLRRPGGGRIEFDGQDVTHLRGRALVRHRGRMQMVFQDPNDSLDPRFTVGRSVAEPLLRSGRGQRRERVARALLDVGLEPDAAQRRPHEFSGGQRQRIAIARAMVTGPQFVVLDEPTSALDVSVQAQILNLLVRLQAETGVTYLFISHDLAVVHHMAHRVAVMNHGEIVEQGPGEQILRAPQHPYTRSLVASVPEVYRV